jgi:hypothetical protein
VWGSSVTRPKRESSPKKKAKVPAPTTHDPNENPLLTLMREYNTRMTRDEFFDLNYSR